MKKQSLPIGVSDFKKLRTKNFYYIDKTDFIREIIETAAEVILLPRPRRFGKTLNLDMLKVFFEKIGKDNKKLFQGLSIEKQNCFDTHQGKYPVIFMTLKDLKHTNWKECFQNLKTIVYDEYARHRYLLDGDMLFPEEKTRFQKILNGRSGMADCANSLKYLSKFLHRYHNSPVIILIDEYDTPIHAGYNNGYYEKIVGFIRNFLSGGLKDNSHLFKGVLTGILRVAKESIFSGLNNLAVYTIMLEEFSDHFGFTDDEVCKLLSDYEISKHYDEVAKWYDGYRFGDKTIYNPWSLINYVNSKSKRPLPYWINTGDTSMIDHLATRGGKEIREEIGMMIEGRSVQLPVYETIVLRDLDLRDDLLWSLLLFTGYLRPVRQMDDEIWELCIPNREILMMYRDLIKRWFATKVERNQLLEMIRGLETGNVKLFERLLQKVVIQIMSYHDFGGEPEKVYHALVLGMLVWLDGKYDIRSNRESGYGRYDIMLKPKGDNKNRTGIVIEFKIVEKADNNAHKQVLKDALKQIKDRKYATELRASGITDILEIAVAFKGKKLWVDHRRLQTTERYCMGG
ncbi:AAA family ATPase [Desulfobacterales bacterium HSG16]|nr:AAA family ATPase [Desulfobacterales bacterium HSG16]